MLQRVAAISRNRYVVAVVTGGIAGVILLVFFLLVRGQRDTIVLQVEPLTDPTIVRVYVGGEVKSPSLYSLSRGSRVADAIALAGGLLPTSDTSSLGMASVLEDSDQIIVPAHSPTRVPAMPVSTRAPSVSAPTVTTGISPVPSAVPSPDGPIDINTADVTELDLLPGIGIVIAGRIVEYRMVNGPFQTIDELEAIDGISLRMVEELRPLLTLGA